MAQGFIAFALASVFLLALFSSGQMMSQPPSHQFQKYRVLQLEELAIKRALYDSVSHSAAESFAAAVAFGQDPYLAAASAAQGRLAAFEPALSSQGYDALIWCGSPSEEALLQSSAMMAASKAALLPTGAQGIASPDCQQSVQVSIASRKVHFSSVGFSAYFPLLGYGASSRLPSGFEVDF
jgi:hypothetical protein